MCHFLPSRVLRLESEVRQKANRRQVSSIPNDGHMGMVLPFDCTSSRHPQSDQSGLIGTRLEQQEQVGKIGLAHFDVVGNPKVLENSRDGFCMAND